MPSQQQNIRIRERAAKLAEVTVLLDGTGCRRPQNICRLFHLVCTLVYRTSIEVLVTSPLNRNRCTASSVISLRSSRVHKFLLTERLCASTACVIITMAQLCRHNHPDIQVAARLASIRHSCLVLFLLAATLFAPQAAAQTIPDSQCKCVHAPRQQTLAFPWTSGWSLKAH